MKDNKSMFMIWRSEATLSHFVAWTLACATEEGEKRYGKNLSDYSKKILFFLLFGENYETELANSVENIEVKREDNRVDVSAKITLSNKKKYALFLELKLYSHTTKEQLQAYKNIAVDNSFEKKYVLLGAWNDTCLDSERKLCEDLGFSIFTFANLEETVFKGEIANSEEKLFNEFWTGHWVISIC